MDKHPLVAQNDARAMKQWAQDPPAWQVAEEEWMGGQAELVCSHCLRPHDYQSAGMEEGMEDGMEEGMPF